MLVRLNDKSESNFSHYDIYRYHEILNYLHCISHQVADQLILMLFCEDAFVR